MKFRLNEKGKSILALVKAASRWELDESPKAVAALRRAVLRFNSAEAEEERKAAWLRCTSVMRRDYDRI